MTCEDIIERLLAEKHISVKEAMIMIKELVVHTNSFSHLHTGSDLDIDRENSFWKNNSISVCGTANPYASNFFVKPVRNDGTHID